MGSWSVYYSRYKTVKVVSPEKEYLGIVQVGLERDVMSIDLNRIM